MRIGNVLTGWLFAAALSAAWAQTKVDFRTQSKSIDFSAASPTGAATGDSIAPGWPATLESGLTGSMLVSASNAVVVRLCNLSGATLTPAAQSFRATVLKGF